MTFWQNCERIMLDYDITQEAFGRAVGASSATVHRWKKGSIPRPATIARICETFNVTRDQLLSDELALVKQADRMGELRGYFMSLDDDGRDALLAVARQMAKGSE